MALAKLLALKYSKLTEAVPVGVTNSWLAWDTSRERDLVRKREKQSYPYWLGQQSGTTWDGWGCPSRTTQTGWCRLPVSRCCPGICLRDSLVWKSLQSRLSKIHLVACMICFTANYFQAVDHTERATVFVTCYNHIDVIYRLRSLMKICYTHPLLLGLYATCAHPCPSPESDLCCL